MISFLYETPNDGMQTIGCHQVGGLWQVGWLDARGEFQPLKSIALKARLDENEARSEFGLWAIKRKLKIAPETARVQAPGGAVQEVQAVQGADSVPAPRNAATVERGGPRQEPWSPKALKLAGIETAPASLDEATAAIRESLATALRLGLRVACLAAHAKRVLFRGEFAPWCHWMEQEFRLTKRMAITWCNAGELLLSAKRGLAQRVALRDMGLSLIEMLCGLSDADYEQLWANHPDLAELSREELREAIRALRGQAAALPARRSQPALPGWEELQSYDPAELDPEREGHYLGAFANRFLGAVEAQRGTLSEDLRREIAETADEFEGAARRMRELIATREEA